MKYFNFMFVIVFALPTLADNTLWPDAASKFLASMDCEFSAFTIYTGPSVSNMLGQLKKGQAKSTALCASTYEEGGALNHKFCWLRALDMKKGIYTATDKKGSSWRVEGKSCSKDALEIIFDKPIVKNQIQLKAVNSQWKIEADRHEAGKSFLNLISSKTK